jgi:hypothetical protein
MLFEIGGAAGGHGCDTRLLFVYAAFNKITLVDGTFLTNEPA